MSLFVFHDQKALLALCSGQRVFSRKEFSKEAIRELESFDKRGKKRILKFVD